MRFPASLALGALLALTVPACQKIQELDSTGRETGRGFLGIGPQGKQGSGVTIALDYAPKPVRVGRDRSITVAVAVNNSSKRQQTLENNGQRIEILLREPGGKVLTRWSESRSFDAKLTSSIVNPGEKIEFTEKISTRDLRPGGSYELVAYVPGAEDRLKAVLAFTAE